MTLLFSWCTETFLDFSLADFRRFCAGEDGRLAAFLEARYSSSAETVPKPTEKLNGILNGFDRAQEVT